MDGTATMAQHAGDHAMTAQPPGGMPAADATMTHEQGPAWDHSVAAIILGVWLITSPFALNYRSSAPTWSDVLSGALIIALAAVTLVRGSV